ncbi:membrane protein insertion efficiency factor YidD [Azorhizobium doebereinerae]|uniref:membrane protein insertion efficiency factor YidD n=1 Tax=Azorhizobium doebereinerae TaxID=281091 RepID=UPI00041F1AB2|nr:membrane protein insertion efficiency factor YidD [Azorhizobium doebereinerae]
MTRDRLPRETLPFPRERPVRRALARLPRLLLRGPILAYRYTLSAFLGRQCRYLPTCSAYADEAIARHGAWAGGWMATARLCRCHPWGGAGFDPVPQCLPAEARWDRPWRYGAWRSPPDGGLPDREPEA